MISIVILGTGNVASHLINAFLDASTVRLIQVYGRKESALQVFSDKVDATSNLVNLKEADVYIIAISDDEISKFSSHLNPNNGLVVHTSGSVAMQALKSNSNKGVFYPLQTFSKEYSIDFNTVPICLETEKSEDLILLEKVASAISNNVFFIDSDQRKQLHMAAVFTNNFVNHMYKMGSDICEEHGIPFEILHPLIMETANKIKTTNPNTIQTGPARRNDIKTINAHLALLSDESKKIYELLTQSIKKTYEQKL